MVSLKNVDMLVSNAHLSFVGAESADTHNHFPNFWELTTRLGDSVSHHTGALLQDTTTYATVSKEISHFKELMTNVIISAGELRREIESKVSSHGITLQVFSEMLAHQLEIVAEELKAEFPPPDHAEHHEDRVKIISRALIKVEDVVVQVCATISVSEVDVRAHFRNITPHLRDALIIIGKQNLPLL